MKKEPGTGERGLVQRALDGVYGVDINPFATAIARFRLVVAALKASQIGRLIEAPDYRINVTAGDSLLHGRWFLTAADSLSMHGQKNKDFGFEEDAAQLQGHPEFEHAYDAEDIESSYRNGRQADPDPSLVGREAIGVRAVHVRAGDRGGIARRCFARR